MSESDDSKLFKTPEAMLGTDVPPDRGRTSTAHGKHLSLGKSVLAYTALFAVVFACAYVSFFAAGKSLIWSADGLDQHYWALIAIGKGIRSIVGNLFTTGTLDLQFFDFSIGYGSDALITFSYYGLGDPLCWTSALCPQKYAEYLYDALIVVRMFLAGLFFMLFCRYTGRNHTGAIVAAVVYALCGWSLYAGIRHPFFLNPLMYLPLLLLGAEKILRKERPILFVAVVFLSALSNYYFFYMLFIGVFLYVLARFLCTKHKQPLREFGATFVKFLGFGVLGFAMASVLIVPTIIALLGSSRANTSPLVAPSYSLEYYGSLLPVAFTTGNSIGAWVHAGVSAPAILGLALTFAHKGNREIKLLFFVFLAILLVPFAAHVMNGFSYVSNRWTWMMAFLLSFALASSWDRLIRPERRDIIVLAAFLAAFAIYIAVASSLTLIREVRLSAAVTSCIIMAITCLAAVFIPAAIRAIGSKSAKSTEEAEDANTTAPQPRESRRFGKCAAWLPAASAVLLSVGLAVGIASNAYYLYDQNQGNYVDEFLASGSANDSLASEAAIEAANLASKSKSIKRVDDTVSTTRNAVQTRGVSSTGYFWSLGENAAPQYLFDMSLKEMRSFIYRGVDGRTFLEALAGVRYYTGGEAGVPYGFEEVSEGVYKNKYALPLGYTYSSSMTNDEYQSLDSPQKQEALMQSVVFDDDASGLPEDAVQSNQETLDYTAQTKGQVVQLDDGSYMVGKAGATLILTVNCPKNRELYLYLKGLNVEYKSELDLWFDGNDEIKPKSGYEALSDEKKQKLQQSALSAWAGQQSSFWITAECNGVSKSLGYYTPYNSYYNGQTDFAINLGYSDEKRSTITITFPKTGIYKFDSASVVAQSMDDYPSWVSNLKQNVLENVSMDTDKVSGTISLDERRALVLSIPYSKGWTAKVDGQEVQLHKANGMFMGLALDAGDHTIELTYRTPGLTAGIAISVVAFILFVALVVRTRKPSEKRKAAHSRKHPSRTSA